MTSLLITDRAKARMTLCALLGLGIIHWFVLPDLALNRKIPAYFAATSMTAMALCFVLAARWNFVESITRGLDKSYRLHRYLGIYAVLAIVVHWVLVPGGAGMTMHMELAEIGKISGDIAVGLFILTVTLSLLKALPYHIWKNSHYLMGPAFMVAVFHSFASDIPLKPFSFAWNYVLFISVLGLWAWVYKLAKTILRRPRFVVQSVTRHGDRAHVIVAPRRARFALRKVQAGQFLFIRFEAPQLREAHPFSIAGVDADGRIELHIRMAGDFTQALFEHLEAGVLARVDGPYGRFLPAQGAPKQLWVSGGVGLAPFLSAIQSREVMQDRDVALLVYVKSEADVLDWPALQAARAQYPHFDFQILADQNGRPPAPVALQAALETREHVYFCGPEGLRKVIEREIDAVKAKHPLRQYKLDYEAFDMRGAVSLKKPKPVTAPKRAKLAPQLRPQSA